MKMQRNDLSQENLVGSLTDIVMDGALRENCESYAIDTNVIFAVTGLDDNLDSEVSVMKDLLSDMRVTLYRSVLNEYSTVASKNSDFEKKLARELFYNAFNKSNIRFVDDKGYYEAHFDKLIDRNQDLADDVAKYENMLGKADCDLIVQAALEGNTVYTSDGPMANVCKSIGVPVIEPRKGIASEYSGGWKF